MNATLPGFNYVAVVIKESSRETLKSVESEYAKTVGDPRVDREIRDAFKAELKMVRDELAAREAVNNWT